MKTLLLASLFLAPIAHASPATLQCESLKPSRYSATVRGEEAQVSDSRDEKSPFSLGCISPQHLHSPEGSYTMYACSEKDVADAGYRLVVNMEGMGVIHATLSETSLSGGKELASFVCRWSF